MARADLVHDLVDERERLMSEAEDIVNRIFADQIERIATEASDMQEIFVAIALLVEQEMDRLTTQAVQSGHGVVKR